ncbi:MAG: hypothetical protein KDD61_18010 [Bdellovibrionales bacterium]|nr:hypothetical protein [Bdellovibrionales bacterium]
MFTVIKSLLIGLLVTLSLGLPVIPTLASTGAKGGGLCVRATAGDPRFPFTKEEAQLIESAQIKFYSSMKPLMELFYLGFPKTSALGTWMARAKDPLSMGVKLGKIKIERMARNPKFKFTSFTQISEAISDGLGGRLIIDRPSESAMDTFTHELVALVKAKKVEVLRIENYWGERDGVPYLSKKQVEQILDAINGQQSQTPTVVTGDLAKRASGYTSLHLDLRLPNGQKVELQVRGRILQQLAEVSHLFYDSLNGKAPASTVFDHPEWSKALQLIEKMDEQQKALYKVYLAAGFRTVRNFISGRSVTSPPEFPLPEHLGALEIENLARSYGYSRLADFMKDPLTYDPNKIDYAMFGSARLVTAGLPEIFNPRQYFEDVPLPVVMKYHFGLQSAQVIQKIIGNVAQGSTRYLPWHLIAKPFFKVHEMLGNLKYVAVIAWEEHHILEKRRGVLRKGGVWAAPIELPVPYLKSQKLGRDNVYVGEIHFMQDSGNNATGAYTVVNNAHAIKKGKLDPTDTNIFPPIQVWRDVTGRIWTLDHRRLISLNLAEWREKIPVEFVSEKKAMEDRFKFTNASDGKSIILHFDDLPGFQGESPLAVVVLKMPAPPTEDSSHP